MIDKNEPDTMSIYSTNELKKRIRLAAANDEKSMSTFVNEILEEFLNDSEKVSKIKNKVKIILVSGTWTPMEIIDWLTTHIPNKVKMPVYKALDWEGRNRRGESKT